MLPPYELKNKVFSKALRGYSTVEVDEHVDFIIEKYSELYRENDELERKLKTTIEKLDELKKDEESIRSALINAQKTSAKILSDSHERADTIVRSAKSNCDEILIDFKDKIKYERDSLYSIREQASEFKAQLFEQYRTHIELIEQLSPNIDDHKEWEVEDETYSSNIVKQIKKDVAASYDVELADEEEEKNVAETIEISETNIVEDKILEIPAHLESNVEVKNEAPDKSIFDFIKTNESKNQKVEKQQSDTRDDIDVSENKNTTNEVADTREHIKIQRTPVNTSQSQYKINSVKDTIKELNKRFLNNESNESTQTENDINLYGNNNMIIDDDDVVYDSKNQKKPTEEDSEFIEFVQNVTSKDKKISKNVIDKNKTKPITSTQEFEMIYSSENILNNKKNNVK